MYVWQFGSQWKSLDSRICSPLLRNLGRKLTVQAISRVCAYPIGVAQIQSLPRFVGFRAKTLQGQPWSFSSGLPPARRCGAEPITQKANLRLGNHDQRSCAPSAATGQRKVGWKELAKNHQCSLPNWPVRRVQNGKVWAVWNPHLRRVNWSSLSVLLPLQVCRKP